MAPNKQLTRTCASCGIEKPLTAFLQLTESGTSYGVLCASCRGQGTKVQKATKEEDRSGIPTGQRIGAKEKAFLDKEQFRQIKDLKELYKQELKKKDDVAKTKSEKVTLTEKLEKNHRQNYLERKRNFLSKKTQPSALETTQTLDISNQNEITDEAIRKAATHFNHFSAFSNPRQLGNPLFNSEAYLTFINFLGTATDIPMITMLAQFNKKLAALSDKKTTPYTSVYEKKSSVTQQKEIDEKTENDLTDFAKNSWGRRRP